MSAVRLNQEAESDDLNANEHQGMEPREPTGTLGRPLVEVVSETLKILSLHHQQNRGRKLSQEEAESSISSSQDQEPAQTDGLISTERPDLAQSNNDLLQTLKKSMDEVSEDYFAPKKMYVRKCWGLTSLKELDKCHQEGLNEQIECTPSEESFCHQGTHPAMALESFEHSHFSQEEDESDQYNGRIFFVRRRINKSCNIPAEPLEIVDLEKEDLAT